MNEHDGTDLDMEDAVEIAAPASKSLSHRYLIGAAAWKIICAPYPGKRGY